MGILEEHNMNELRLHELRIAEGALTLNKWEEAFDIAVTWAHRNLTRIKQGTIDSVKRDIQIILDRPPSLQTNRDTQMAAPTPGPFPPPLHCLHIHSETQTGVLPLRAPTPRMRSCDTQTDPPLQTPTEWVPQPQREPRQNRGQTTTVQVEIHPVPEDSEHLDLQTADQTMNEPEAGPAENQQGVQTSTRDTSHLTLREETSQQQQEDQMGENMTEHPL